MSNDSVCPTFRKVLVASVFGVCLFLIPGGVQSATSNSATLQWAPNQEPDLGGYRTYHGTTSGNYGSPHNIGNETTYRFDNLAFNTTHYFSVTAHDTSGNESPPSLEVSKAIGPDQLAEAAKLAEEQRLAEAAKLAEEQQLAEAAKLAEEQQLAKAEKKEQKKLAKAEKKEQKKLAKAEKLSAKIQKALAKIETKLVRYADKPKAVARLNKKKEKYSMVLAKIQEKYSIN